MKEELKAADAAMCDVRSLTFDVLELKYRNHDPKHSRRAGARKVRRMKEELGIRLR